MSDHEHGLTEPWLKNALQTGATASSTESQEHDPVVLDPETGLVKVSKLPAATAVSPGAESIAHFNAVESVTEDWFYQQKRLLETYAPGVSVFRGGDFVLPASLVTGLAAASVGGAGAVSGATLARITNAFVANPSAQPWGFALRAKIPVPASGQSSLAGFLLPSSTTGIIGVGSYYATSVPSRTRLYVQMSDPSWAPVEANGALVIDGGLHTLTVAFDLGTLRVLVDGVVDITVPNAHLHLPTSPCYLQVQSLATAAHVITDWTVAA